jgi:DNA-binding NarL/FixJ family response regulator
MKKKIVILEDHPLFTDGILNILKDENQFEVVQNFKHLPDFIHFIYKNKVDIIIADIKIENEFSIPLLKVYKKENKYTGIILLSMFQPWEIQVKENEFEFESYVLKNSGSKIIIDALRHVAKGERFLDPLIQWENNLYTQNQPLLTRREKEIIDLIKEGKTTREIAEKLFLSELTIKSHRQNMLKKFKVNNMVELLMKINIK